jgi:hypothetical protein
MSSRLTLLLICEERERYPVLISALQSAEFDLITADTPEAAMPLLGQNSVDAMLVHPRKSLARPAYVALKRRAQDDVLVHAVAVFLRESLVLSQSPRSAELAARTAARPIQSRSLTS